MNVKIAKIAQGAALVVLVLSTAGCSPPEPAATPISQRKPGEDISAEARAEKRGDQPASPEASTAAPAGASPVRK